MIPSFFEFSSETENLAKARDFVRQFLESEKIADETATLLVLGIDEACSNIMRHAYQGSPGQRISLSCERDGTMLRFKLRDFGRPVDPTRFERRDPDEVVPGGLGLHLIERIFDEATYIHQSQGTELVLSKRL